MNQRATHETAFANSIFFLLLLVIAPILSHRPVNLSRYETILIYLMVALGLNLTLGFAGQLSLGQPAIMGASAYGAGVLSVKSHWNSWATFLPAIALGIGVGIIINLPGYRLKGWYLTFTTVLAVIVFPDFLGGLQSLTGGTDGLGPIKTFPRLGPPAPGLRLYGFVAAVAFLVFIGYSRLCRSRAGIVLRAMRDSPNAAQSCGLNMSVAKLIVSAVAGLPVAIGGWMLAHVSGFLGPSSFGSQLLLLLLAAVMLGGRGTVWGPVAGIIVFEALSFWIGPFSSYNQLAIGGGVLLVAVGFPGGVVPVARELRGFVGDRARSLGGRPAGKAEADPGASAALQASGPDTPAMPHSSVPSMIREAREPERDASSGPPFLELKGVDKAFGGFEVLRSVDLTIGGAGIYGLVGPNGSGKTTILNVITGFVRPDGGQVFLRGRNVTGLTPYQIARAGVRRSFQVPQIIGELSVAENMLLGLIGQEGIRVTRSIIRTPGYRRTDRSYGASVRSTADLLGFSREVVETPVERLPLGIRRIVEIGRAMVADPVLMCLDEPAAGLGDADLELLADTLVRLRGAGHAILLIEHNLPFVRRVCDTVFPLEAGVVVVAEEWALLQQRREWVGLGARPDGSPTTRRQV